MSNLVITAIPVGPVQTNCYVVANEDSKMAVVFDPGEEADKINAYLNSQQYQLEAILLTHGHFDHITGVSKLSAYTNAKSYLSEKDKEISIDQDLNCAALFGFSAQVCPDELVNDQDILEFLGTKIQVIATPGHTKGSVCYYFKEEKILISGDTLFFESCGRTDFPTGSSRQMYESLNMLLTTLPEDVVVYPGHGPKTSIGYEERNNPYMNGV